jgi:hypothetical protein
VKVRRQLQVGDEVMIPARITRIGRNTSDTADAVTVELRIGQKVTGNPDYLLGDADEA